jgi:hypothetical protein
MERHETSPLLKLVDTWLRKEAQEYKDEQKKEAEAGEFALQERNDLLNPQHRGGGYTAGRMHDFV